MRKSSNYQGGGGGGGGDPLTPDVLYIFKDTTGGPTQMICFPQGGLTASLADC